MKTRFLLFFVVLFLNISIFKSIAQVPTCNLLGYYPFSGDANDQNGNSLNGSVYGANLVNDRFENLNKAYYFNGINNFIALPSSFDALPRTINLWIYAKDTNYFGLYGGVYQSDNPNLLYGNTGIAVKTINGENKLLLTIAAITDTVDIIPETWVNISMSVNANKQIKYYVNKQLVGTKTFNTFYCSNDGIENTFIGANRSGSGCYFKGKIDDIRIYNKELS